MGETVYLPIRPEDVTLTLARAPSSARNSFAGRIARILPLCPLERVEIDCGFPLLTLITKQSVEEMSIKIGTSVFASFKATAVRAIRKWAY